MVWNAVYDLTVCISRPPQCARGAPAEGVPCTSWFLFLTSHMLVPFPGISFSLLFDRVILPPLSKPGLKNTFPNDQCPMSIEIKLLGKHEVPTQHIQKYWIRPCTSLLKYPMSTIIKTHPDLNHIDKMLSNKIGKDFLSTKVIEIKEKKNKYTKKLETSVVCKRTWKFCIGQKIGILKK